MINFGTPHSYGSIAETIPLYGLGEFESPTRSTIPMLSLLIHAPDTFNEIVQLLAMPSAYDLYLEFQVPPPQGQGMASHTDVMLRSGAESLAIEAKWTEPMYPPVGPWLIAGNNPQNRVNVLDGWLDLLQQRVTKQLVANEFNDVIYQMLHRAASAASAGNSPRLAYFLFEPSPNGGAATPDAVYEKLSLFWDILGQPMTFPFYLVKIGIKPREAYEQLRLLPIGAEGTAEAMILALQDPLAPLFNFEIIQCQRVGGPQ
jgi:hypothetical protein